MCLGIGIYIEHPRVNYQHSWMHLQTSDYLTRKFIRKRKNNVRMCAIFDPAVSISLQPGSIDSIPSNFP